MNNLKLIFSCLCILFIVNTTLNIILKEKFLDFEIKKTPDYEHIHKFNEEVLYDSILDTVDKYNTLESKTITDRIADMKRKLSYVQGKTDKNKENSIETAMVYFTRMKQEAQEKLDDYITILF
tara:strand:+ start:32 stop:400 length:369 start_codon:yes stop_codon:yes gene_type:complete